MKILFEIQLTLTQLNFKLYIQLERVEKSYMPVQFKQLSVNQHSTDFIDKYSKD